MFISLSLKSPLGELTIKFVLYRIVLYCIVYQRTLWYDIASSWFKLILPRLGLNWYCLVLVYYPTQTNKVRRAFYLPRNFHCARVFFVKFIIFNDSINETKILNNFYFSSRRSVTKCVRRITYKWCPVPFPESLPCKKVNAI